MRQADSLDALQFSKSPTCLRPYKYPQDLELLNETACFTVMYDFAEEGNPKKVWANAAWLQYVGQTLEEFQSFDFAANTSAHIKKQMWQMGQAIQIKKETMSVEHTAYPRDKPVRVLMVQRPIMFEEMEHPLILVHYFNGDNSLADDGKADEPLNFQVPKAVQARARCAEPY